MSAEVPLSAAVPAAGAAAQSVVLAAVAGPAVDGGNGGTYAASDLKPSGSWSGGGNSGTFRYTYPVTVPPAASDLVPSVALSYDSGQVDGQTASTQAQASWVGDGWSTGQSYIEQSFASCKDKPEDVASPKATSDLCYDGPILTMSLNGSSSRLVRDSTTGKWKPESDKGELIVRELNTGNGSGTHDSDYWTVTTRNGTTYQFGRNRLPGWDATKLATNSVDTVPVYSPHSSGPCYDSAGFSSSVCTMARRWNLDFVADAHGNAMSYYYTQETNRYGRNEGASMESYVRDSYLSRIEYGLRSTNAYTTAPNRVEFTVDGRCTSGSCATLDASTKANWPDVPYDLICTTGTCDAWAPSFFSTKRLTTITTKQYDPAVSQYLPVDSYALSNGGPMPATQDGTSPTLWLSEITRTGQDTTAANGLNSAITLPSVSFTGIRLQNRVANAGLPVLNRQRIQTITTETGSVITASYGLPEACPATRPAVASNTKSCFPVRWTPDGYTEPFLDWFNKYAVTRVTATDPTGGAPATVTDYSYQDGAAWHYDDNEVVKAKHRTYGQFRGYGTVATYTGN